MGAGGCAAAPHNISVARRESNRPVWPVDRVISLLPSTSSATTCYNSRMSALRSYTVVCPTLIGREPEFALLTDLLKQASSGQGNIALIAGEAGVGKSRLIAAIRERAGAAGGQIVQGSCFEQDRALPYAPLIDLLRSLTANRPAHDLARMLGPAAAELIWSPSKRSTGSRWPAPSSCGG